MERENNAVKFMFNKGSLEESMDTCVEVMTYQELFDLAYDHLSICNSLFSLEFDYYGYDADTVWDAYIVSALDYDGTKYSIGFANGKLHS